MREKPDAVAVRAAVVQLESLQDSFNNLIGPEHLTDVMAEAGYVYFELMQQGILPASGILRELGQTGQQNTGTSRTQSTADIAYQMLWQQAADMFSPRVSLQVRPVVTEECIQIQQTKWQQDYSTQGKRYGLFTSRLLIGLSLGRVGQNLLDYTLVDRAPGEHIFADELEGAGIPCITCGMQFRGTETEQECSLCRLRKGKLGELRHAIFVLNNPSRVPQWRTIRAVVEREHGRGDEQRVWQDLENQLTLAGYDETQIDDMPLDEVVKNIQGKVKPNALSVDELETEVTRIIVEHGKEKYISAQDIADLIKASGKLTSRSQVQKTKSHAYYVQQHRKGRNSGATITNADEVLNYLLREDGEIEESKGRRNKKPVNRKDD